MRKSESRENERKAIQKIKKERMRGWVREERLCAEYGDRRKISKFRKILFMCATMYIRKETSVFTASHPLKGLDAKLE